jgi:glutathionyl-hydroquinone reductase
MFNSAFDGLTGNTADYWPEALRDEIEPVNARIYDTVNNGVYKAGFATTQAAYDEAVARCSTRSTGWRRGCRRTAF